MDIVSNLLQHIDHEAIGEQVTGIAAHGNVRIERIVSHGEASPPNQWYDQAEAEWVLVFAGAAGLVFEGEAEEIVLRAGDHVYIAPHRRHRVAWTDAEELTIWLAVFW
jgi:cupin 2 domain-containing protein